MPISLLLALFLAFGFDFATDAGPGRAAARLSAAETWARLGEVASGLLLVAVFSLLVGRLVAYRVARSGRASSSVRRAYGLGVRAADLLSVLVYGWMIHEVEWPRVVRSGLGLGDPVLLDDALILLPFLLAQFSGWCGIYVAERALRAARGAPSPGGLRRYLWLKGRQTLGMVLPVAALYALGTDTVHRLWPVSRESPWDQPLSLVVMGVAVLVLAPALIRISWPTRPLPPGPLRDRLEHVASRVGFRCTDILVWDTNFVVVNAGVTGSLPWFRYVLLTDALVEGLSPHEVVAVFGHEVGHIAHRHLIYFGFFILASLGLLATTEGAIGQIVDTLPIPAWIAATPGLAVAAQASAFLGVVVVYFLVVFGHVSRRFERQADIFGCRVVSCGVDDCPPHRDPDVRPAGDPGPAIVARRGIPPAPLCPVGIRIFTAALTNVAMLNGMRPTAWSWRHGSIVRRIHFLEGLEGRSDAERGFQRGVTRLRLGMAVVLLGGIGLAWFTGLVPH